MCTALPPPGGYPIAVNKYITITDTEDKLQKAAHKLNQIKTEYGLTF